MIKVLLDQGVPRSSVYRLRDAGWDTVHVYDIGLSQASDRRLLEYARDDGRICITLDADFHALIAVSNDVAPSVIRIRREGLRGPELAQLMLGIWPRIEAQVRQGALITVTAKATRIRLLPIHGERK